MSINSELEATIDAGIDDILTATWNARDGDVVPESEDVLLRNGAVHLDAVVLYADLFSSTELVQSVKHTVAAKVVRAYLASMARLVRASGGAVRSFDGDRVMGVFVGKTKNTQATDCALKMNYVVTKLLKPQVESRLPSLIDAGYELRHCVGVACSPLLVVRGGVRNANDLVFIGDAANIAAKLSEIRNPPWFSYVTEDVYTLIANSSKFSKDKTDMWTNVTRSDIADQKMRLYKSSWRRRP